MDAMRDFVPFRAELDKLCATFDRPPAKDELVNAYWESLRDAHFSEIQRNVKRIIRTATKETKWPKPGELRDNVPAESKRSAASEAAYNAAERQNLKNWGELAKSDLRKHNLMLAIAHHGRTLATTDPDSPEHLEAVRLDRQARDELRELEIKRASA